MTARDHLSIAGLEGYLAELGAESRPPAFTVGPTTGFAPPPAARLPDATYRAMEEPSYSNQTREYANRRIPIFERNLAAIVAETDRLVALYRSRISVGTVQGSGEQAVMAMPISGACPRNGPLAYVYDDIFAAAQANLAALGREKPPRYSPFTVIERWSTLIARNIDLMFVASNIAPRFRFADAQPRRWNAWSAGSASRTIRGPYESKDGYPYPSYNGQRNMAWPQIVADTEDAMSAGLRAALRIHEDPAIANYIPSEDCYFGGSCPRPLVTYHRAVGTSMATSAFRTYSGSDHLLPGNTQTLSFSDRRWDYFRKSFEPTREELSSGAVASGGSTAARGAAGRGGAWDTLMAVFLMAAPGMPHRRLYYNAIGSLLLDQTIAQAFARTSLMQMILDALGFYVFNHNVWYAEKLGLTVEQLRAHQRALVAAGLDQTSAPILAVTGAVGTLINPAIGVIIVVLNEIGKLLLTEFIQPRPDSPKPLFLRIPDPNVCRDSPEAQAGSYLCPEGTTGAYPNCVTAPPARCPEGTTGTPPNCVPIPGTTPPARCPEGTTGTPPNCTPVSRGVRCPDGSFARTPGECPNGGGGGGGGGGGDVKGGGGGLLIGAAALLLLSRFLR